MKNGLILVMVLMSSGCAVYATPRPVAVYQEPAVVVAQPEVVIGVPTVVVGGYYGHGRR